MTENSNSQRKLLSAKFFNRPTVTVAQELLGKFLVNPVALNGPKAICITEVEAYVGEDDLASHARVGRTKRTAPMYGTAGTIYVYKIYGLHFCFNVVTEAAGFPAAILVRAGVGVDNFSDLAVKKGMEDVVRLGLEKKKSLITGPGLVCRFLDIDTRFNTAVATSIDSIHFEDQGVQFAKYNSGPRIGISRAVDTPWRFYIS